MKPAPFAYHDPTTLAELTALLGGLDDLRLLAGGQSLMPMMNFRFLQPANLVDLNRVAGLDRVELGAEALQFGAMVRQRTLHRSPELAARAPVIAAALDHVGHRQTRARGTIGGSLCHFDPSAELCNMAALHDARLELTGPGGTRTLDFAEFGLGYLTTAVGFDEALTGIRFRAWPKGHGWGFEEFSLRRGDFAVCAASCLLTLDGAGRIERVALAISGVTEVPARLREAEAAITGQMPGPAVLDAVAEAAGALDAMSDAYVDAAYRRHLARQFARRVLTAALRRAEEGVPA